MLDNQIISNSLKILISSIIMIIACYFLRNLLFLDIGEINIFVQILILFLIIVFCKIIYLAMIFMLKVISITNLKGYIKK